MLNIEVATPEETIKNALHDPIIQVWLLNEYPRDKPQAGMNQEMAKMR